MNQFTEKNVYATSGTEVPRYRKLLNRAYCSIQNPQLSVMILFFNGKMMDTAIMICRCVTKGLMYVTL